MDKNTNPTFISKFLKIRNVQVPDNNTPDNETASKVKQILKTILSHKPDIIVNEADLIKDLAMSNRDFTALLLEIESSFNLTDPILENLLLNHPCAASDDNADSQTEVETQPITTVGEIIALIDWIVKQKSQKNKHGYELFDLEEIMDKIRERYAGMETRFKKNYFEFLNSFPNYLIVEDLPFYKEYISRFSMDIEFEGMEFKHNPEVSLTKADCDILVKLVCSSNAANYDFDINKDDNTLEFIIMVSDGGKTIKRKLEELKVPQIKNLYRIFIGVLLDSIYESRRSEKDLQAIIEKQRLSFMVFNKKMLELKDKRWQAKENYLELLDELLNS